MAVPFKRRALSLNDKMKIIKYYDKKSKNYKKTQIAGELGLAISTLSTILKSRKDTEEKCRDRSNQILRRKRNKSGKFTELENILVDWVHSMKSQNMPITGPAIKKRAMEIASDLELPDFTGSNGWLGRFKKRHIIVFKNTEDTNSDGEESSISSLDTNYQDILKDYGPGNTFNADEFALLYRLMPNEERNVMDKKCENGSLASERLTILACANSNGTEKLPLLVIGNTKIDKNQPCQYITESQSWMTKDIFVKWLKVLDEYFEIQGRLVLLLVDNSPVHPKEVILNNINLVLIPSDLEYDMPMAQGIVRAIKQNYRTKIIENFQASDESTDGDISRRTMSISDALQQICDAWDSVKPGIIQSSFKKSGLGDYYDVDDDDDEYKADICVKYNDYMYVDYEIATCRQQENVNYSEVPVLEENIDEDDVSLQEEDDNGSKLREKQAAAAAVTSIANLKQYLRLINSQDGLEKLFHIENIVADSIGNINNSTHL